MTAVAAVLALIGGGALFQIQSVPWTPGKSTCFTADTNLDGRAEVCVLQEYTLRIYGRRLTEPLCTVVLPAHTSAIDIGDLDQDGAADLIAICQEKILRFGLGERQAGDPELLFTHENQFSHASGYPFPAVLMVDRGAGPLMALPGGEALEIRSASGDLVDSYPIGVNAPYQVSIGRPFSYWTNQHAQTGGPDTLEFRISSTASFKPLLPDDAFPIEVDTPSGRPGTNRQQWEADEHDPESWPWFTVANTAEGAVRALYRKADARAESTSVRVRTVAAAGAAELDAGDNVGPARHYPGTLILQPDSIPDFNNDGYADLALWKSPQPGLTADSLARAASSKRWPVNITTHLFLPEKKRFEATPGSRLALEVPVAWFFAPSRLGPLQAVIQRDFNGDGKTDLGCLTAEDVLSVWQAGDGGLIERPAFQHRFPVPVDEVLFETDLEGLGSTSVAIRCGATLAILRPQPGLPVAAP